MMRQKMLRKSVDKPINQPNTINVVDVIKLEHDTRKGKGGLHNSTYSNAQQSLGMSDDKRYSEGNELPIITNCGFKLLNSKNKTCMLGLFTNVLI